MTYRATSTVSPETVTPRRFSVAEYHRMAEAGILTEDDHVELIDGEILQMTPIGPRHLLVVNRLNEQLVLRLAGKAIVSVQNPVRLSGDTEPQPDLAVLRLESADAERLPTGDDVLLLIEVADSSAAYERTQKIPRYARAGIREVWVVDLARDVVEQYTHPGEAGYESRQTFRKGQSVQPLAVALALPVEEILG